MDITKYKAPAAPRRNEFATTYWYKGGKLLALAAPNHPVIFAEGIKDMAGLHGVAPVSEVDELAFQRARAEYYETVKEINSAFKRDLLAEFDITDHPKAETFWRIISEDRDMPNTYFEAERLIDLIK